MSRPIPNTNEIQMYLHCELCLNELREKHWNPVTDRPTIAPVDFARLSVGMTPLGFQVWCERHQANVLHVDFQGQRHPANNTRVREPGETLQ